MFELDFSRGGEPKDNALIESFNDKLRTPVPEREQVPEPGGRLGEDRVGADRLQRPPIPQRTGQPSPHRVRFLRPSL